MSDQRAPDSGPEFERAFYPDAGEARAEAERETLRAAQERKELLAALLRNPNIRTWLWELLTEWNTFNTQFGDHTAGHAAGQVSFYWRGMHDAGWRLWTQLDDAAPELASLMRRERNPGSGL